MDIRWIRTDITKLTVDAVVTAANIGLAGGGGVDGAIHRAAGPDLIAACKAIGGCPAGEAKITPGFKLPAQWVIHAVGPIWRGGAEGEAGQLAGAYLSSLTLAHAYGCRTIAFPAISCGSFGYPVVEAIRIAVQAVGTWSMELPERVIFVGFDDAVAAELRGFLGPPASDIFPSS